MDTQQHTEATPETPAVETANNTPTEPKNRSEEREATIQGLVDAIKSERGLQEQEHLNSEDNHKVDYSSMVDALGEDGQKFVSNLRRSYTQKTQELSEQRKLLQAQASELEAQRNALLQSEFAKGIKEKAESPDVEIDLLQEESVAKRIEQEVARRLNEMIQPMQQEYTLQQRKMALHQFKNDHPDLEDYKMDVAKELKADQNLSLEKAYWLVKGRSLSSKMETQKDELSKYREAARAAGLKVGGLSRGRKAGVPQNVRSGGAWEIYKFLQNKKK
jgi:hypothetical protein